MLSGDSSTISLKTNMGEGNRGLGSLFLYSPVCQEMPTLFHCVGPAHRDSGIEGLLTTAPVIVSGLKHVPSGLVVD